MKVGVLQTDTLTPELRRDYGCYSDMFRDLLLKADAELYFQKYDVTLDQYPRQLDDHDVYLITGSKDSVYEKRAWIHELEAFVRLIDERRKKLVGVCFGHQLVAQALGGRTTKCERGWGVGCHTYDVMQSPSWSHPSKTPVTLIASHQDQVVDVPDRATVLARSEFCPVASMQIGEHILTYQPHPEFCSDFALDRLNSRREIVGERCYQEGVKTLTNSKTDDLLVARWIVNFISET